MTHASTTAKLTAATLLVAHGEPSMAGLVDARTAELVAACLRRQGPLFRSMVALRHSRLARRAALLAQRAISPGFCVHYAARKRCIYARGRRAVDEGFRQVVLLGAGFDMMSHLWAENPAGADAGVRVIEADHPATQRDRLRGATAAQLCDGVTHVGVNLETGSLAEALRACRSFDPTADTLFVAEGVFMYLSDVAVDRVFREMRGHDGERRTRCIYSSVAPDRRGRLRLHTQGVVASSLMGALDERFRWGPEPSDWAGFLRARSWTVRHQLSFAEFVAEGAPPALHAHAPRDTGESVIIADAC